MKFKKDDPQALYPYTMPRLLTTVEGATCMVKTGMLQFRRPDFVLRNPNPFSPLQKTKNQNHRIAHACGAVLCNIDRVARCVGRPVHYLVNFYQQVSYSSSSSSSSFSSSSSSSSCFSSSSPSLLSPPETIFQKLGVASGIERSKT